MNQLKPKTRPTAPPSLKKNVMDRIQKEQLYDKAVHKPQASLLNRLRLNRGRMLSAAALLLLIIGITCTLVEYDYSDCITITHHVEHTGNEGLLYHFHLIKHREPQ